MWIAKHWKDYEVLDAGQGEKLERWGKYVLRRPDPQVIWPAAGTWKPDAWYHRAANGGGQWEILRKLPEHWKLCYGSLTFRVRPTGFKHTGLFPEQAANWTYMMEQIARRKQAGLQTRVLNLFAYTGGATLACAAAGASVCHVDAARAMVQWARDNAGLSGLDTAPIRWIVEDCKKFVAREQRRGVRYDAIVMDPPSYGRGPNGEVWKLEDEAFALIDLCVGLLSDNPAFFIVNSYTTGLQPAVLATMLTIATHPLGGDVQAQELGLPVTARGIVLPCGAAGRWTV